MRWLDWWRRASIRQVMAVTAAATTLVAGLLYALERWGGMAPCALCWTQRGMLLGVGLAALLTLAVNPERRPARLVMASILALPLLGGIAVALRHLYVISRPEAVDCGFGIEMMVGMFPWQEVAQALILGQSGCSEVSPLLGLPVPLWSLALFVLLSVALVPLLRPARGLSRKLLN